MEDLSKPEESSRILERGGIPSVKIFIPYVYSNEKEVYTSIKPLLSNPFSPNHLKCSHQSFSCLTRVQLIPQSQESQIPLSQGQRLRYQSGGDGGCEFLLVFGISLVSFLACDQRRIYLTPPGPVGLGPAGPVGLGPLGALGLGPLGALGLGPLGALGLVPAGPVGLGPRV